MEQRPPEGIINTMPSGEGFGKIRIYSVINEIQFPLVIFST
jgi:hypothetical protein